MVRSFGLSFVLSITLSNYCSSDLSFVLSVILAILYFVLSLYLLCILSIVSLFYHLFIRSVCCSIFYLSVVLSVIPSDCHYVLFVCRSVSVVLSISCCIYLSLSVLSVCHSLLFSRSFCHSFCSYNVLAVICSIIPFVSIYLSVVLSLYLSVYQSFYSFYLSVCPSFDLINSGVLKAIMYEFNHINKCVSGISCRDCKMGTEGISAESVYTWAQQCRLPLYLLIFIGSPQGLL